MKYLAIDYGKARTGLAVSDPGETCCFPKKTLAMQGKEKFFTELLQFIQDESVEGIVVGLPLTNKGEDTETTRMVRNMTSRLRHRCDLPLFYMEEYLSSTEAEKRLKAMGKKGKEITQLVDQFAAVIILESFLNLSAPQRQNLAYPSAPPPDNSIPERP